MNQDSLSQPNSTSPEVEIEIEVEPTPNPNALKFLCPLVVTTKGKVITDTEWTKLKR